jgi:hypothetical protein
VFAVSVKLAQFVYLSKMRKDLLEKNNDWSDLNLPVQSRNNMPKSPAKSTDSSKWKKL